MQEHVINIQLKIQARDDLSRADIMRDLRRQLEALQGPAPHRSIHGSGWWTNSRSSVAALNFDSVGDGLEWEAEVGAEWWARVEALTDAAQAAALLAALGRCDGRDGLTSHYAHAVRTAVRERFPDAEG